MILMPVQKKKSSTVIRKRISCFVNDPDVFRNTAKTLFIPQDY